MKNKININTKLTAALKEKVEHTKPLVDAIRKKHNEFVSYWLVCYSAESFEALDLFEPYLFNATLEFCPSRLYDKVYSRNSDLSSYYESVGDGFNKIPQKFSDGPMLLGLSHEETDNRNALFIPTTCLTGRNTALYDTLKKYTPKPEKGAVSTYEYFPSDYYSEAVGLSNRMRSEVTHAVVLYDGNQDGDCNITVRWVRNDLGASIHKFVNVKAIFQYLWKGLEVNPFYGHYHI